VGHTRFFTPFGHGWQESTEGVTIAETGDGGVVRCITLIRPRKTNLGPIRAMCMPVWDTGPTDLAVINDVLESCDRSGSDAVKRASIAELTDDEVGYHCTRLSEIFCDPVHVAGLIPDNGAGGQWYVQEPTRRTRTLPN